MAQTAAHLVDHVIPPVPLLQWVISVPKRLRGFLADRPAAVRALTRIFIAESERLLCAAAGVTSDASAPAALGVPTAARPRLGVVSFLHRFGSALNHHVHLHACITDGVFMPPAAGRRRGNSGIGITGCSRPITSSGPPTDWGEFVQVHDDRAFLQASPDDLPVIDIHSR